MFPPLRTMRTIPCAALRWRLYDGDHRHCQRHGQVQKVVDEVIDTYVEGYVEHLDGQVRGHLHEVIEMYVEGAAGNGRKPPSKKNCKNAKQVLDTGASVC
jgi:hypothetical protein